MAAWASGPSAPGMSISSKPVRPVSSEQSAFCTDLVEGAADRHRLADGLHRGGQHGLGAGEFLEGEAGDLGHDVVDGRLEGGGGDLGDVVVELVERVADGELGGDLGDREAGGLGGEGGGAGDAGVHLDDDQAAGLGVDGELDVGAAGLDADLAQHRDRGVAHHLVFLVGQRQRRGDGDRVAGVHAHRVDVLDRADDDAVVAPCRAPPPSRTPSSRAGSRRSGSGGPARRRGRCLQMRS